jgi:hypothetical protein
VRGCPCNVINVNALTSERIVELVGLHSHCAVMEVADCYSYGAFRAVTDHRKVLSRSSLHDHILHKSPSRAARAAEDLSSEAPRHAAKGATCTRTRVATGRAITTAAVHVRSWFRYTGHSACGIRATWLDPLAGVRKCPAHSHPTRVVRYCFRSCSNCARNRIPLPSDNAARSARFRSLGPRSVGPR